MLVGRVNAAPPPPPAIISLLRTWLLDSEGLADIPLPSGVYSPLNELESIRDEIGNGKLRCFEKERLFLLCCIIGIGEDLIRPKLEMSSIRENIFVYLVL